MAAGGRVARVPHEVTPRDAGRKAPDHPSPRATPGIADRGGEPRGAGSPEPAPAARLRGDSPRSRYQIFTRSDSARIIVPSPVQPNACSNSGMFDSGPITRQMHGECGSVLIRRTDSAGRVSWRQSRA